MDHSTHVRDFLSTMPSTIYSAYCRSNREPSLQHEALTRLVQPDAQSTFFLPPLTDLPAAWPDIPLNHGSASNRIAYCAIHHIDKPIHSAELRPLSTLQSHLVNYFGN